MSRVLVAVLLVSLVSCATPRQAKTGVGVGAITFAIGAGLAGAVIKSGTWEQNQGAVGSGVFLAGGGLVVMTLSLLSLIWVREPNERQHTCAAFDPEVSRWTCKPGYRCTADLARCTQERR